MTTSYAPHMTTATQRHAPAGVGGGYKMETIDSASPEVRALIRQLNKFATATTLDEGRLSLQGFDEDLSLDTPFIQIQGRERVRVLSTLAKWVLGNFEIEPHMVRISVPEGAASKGGILEVDGLVHWMPHRVWWLPATLLLPRDIPIHADVSMGVKAHNDKVYFISGKNHNMPHVPRILRVIAGAVAGMAVSVAEPVYYNLLDWYRAGVQNVQTASATVTNTTARGLDTARDTATSLKESVTTTAERVAAPVIDRVQPLVDKAAETVGMKPTTPTATTPTTGGTTAYA